MKTTIDEAGRLVIPQDILRQAGLQPGTALDVRWHDGRIEIELEPVPATLVRKGRFIVAAPQNATPSLTTDMVEDTRDALAREHERGL